MFKKKGTSVKTQHINLKIYDQNSKIYIRLSVCVIYSYFIYLSEVFRKIFDYIGYLFEIRFGFIMFLFEYLNFGFLRLDLKNI